MNSCISWKIFLTRNFSIIIVMEAKTGYQEVTYAEQALRGIGWKDQNSIPYI